MCINPIEWGELPTLPSLALFQKKRGPLHLKYSHPISLCNVSYKIMAKIIANRLKPYLNSLILPNQGGFVANRQIWDNIILVQEAIHSSVSRGEKGMVVKMTWLMLLIESSIVFLRQFWKKLASIKCLYLG
jgi:hypothetical protein